MSKKTRNAEKSQKPAVISWSSSSYVVRRRETFSGAFHSIRQKMQTQKTRSTNYLLYYKKKNIEISRFSGVAYGLEDHDMKVIVSDSISKFTGSRTRNDPK